MMFRKYLISWFLISLVYSCGNDPVEELIIEPPIENFVPSQSPINLSTQGVDFYQDLSYGDHERNVFDLFIPNASDLVPLVIFIHGGSFVAGDKSFAYEGLLNEQINDLLSSGIAFATINYQYVDLFGERTGIIKSLNDSKYCLQFIRHHSEFLGIDKERIFLEGASAGAGTSLWLSHHDDMKMETSIDPVLMESTRVSGAALWETQATYDLLKWDTHVFQDLNLNLIEQAETIIELRLAIFGFYGIESLEELLDPDIVEYRNSLDMLDLFSPDDPPLWINNSLYSADIPTTSNELTHHPLHAKALRDKANEIGLTAITYSPEIGIEDGNGIDVNDLIKDVLLE